MVVSEQTDSLEFCRNKKARRPRLLLPRFDGMVVIVFVVVVVVVVVVVDDAHDDDDVDFWMFMSLPCLICVCLLPRRARKLFMERGMVAVVVVMMVMKVVQFCVCLCVCGCSIWCACVFVVARFCAVGGCCSVGLGWMDRAGVGPSFMPRRSWFPFALCAAVSEEPDSGSTSDWNDGTAYGNTTTRKDE